jgi:low affinity Fe/Cu permease
MKKAEGRRAPGLERISMRAAEWTGSSTAFALAAAVVIVWALTGPLFHFSNTWQLVINTGTTVVTFLMVFLIQRSQNKDTRAIELKLNELVAAVEGASNRLISIEDMSERDLEMLHKHYRELARMAGQEMEITRSHSLEEARARHSRKFPGERPPHRA